MDFVVNRKGGVPVRDQLVTQLELKILGGELTHGQRLPSVRSLARRLRSITTRSPPPTRTSRTRATSSCAGAPASSSATPGRRRCPRPAASTR